MFAKFKAFYKIYKTYKEIKTMKEKKTEMWIIIATALVNIFMALQGLISPELTAQIISILSGLYLVARSAVKITKTTKDDEILEKIEKILKDNNIELK